MREIVLSMQSGEPVASSRQIAENFEKRHDHVMRDIDAIKKDVPNFGEMFFETTVPDSYGREQRAYLMNRDGFTLLAMGFTGKAALEWKLKYIAAHEELEEKDKQIDTMKPKALFADAVSASSQSILVGEMAKLLSQNGIQMGQNCLFQWMRENGYLIKDKKRTDYNMPTQKSMELRLFEIKETSIAHSDGHTSINKTPKVTGIGQVYFVNLFLKTEKNKKAEG